MSRIVLVEQATPPPVPTIGKVRVYVNSGGTLASIDDAGVVTTYSAGITQEQVEDIVGNLLQDSSSVDVTYNDTGNVATFTVIAGGVNHNALLNYVTNEHINHASVSINAGAGMSGGGDLTTTRTLTNADRGSVAIAAHEALGDPHPQYTTAAELSSAIGAITPASIGAQPLDSDLTAIAGLATQGVLVRTGTGTATTRAIAQGTGITVTNGDGVAGNPTVVLSNVGTAGTTGSATQVAQITTNAQGQVSTATNVAIAIPSAQVTDFAEAVDDRVAALVAPGSGISTTYNDATNTLTIANIDGGTVAVSTHTGLADPHPQYLTAAEGNAAYQPVDSDLTAISALAGTGLIVRTATGAATTRTITNGTAINVSNGDGVSGNPTISLPDTSVLPNAYGSASQVATFTVDQQGRLNAAGNVAIAIPSTQISNFSEAVDDRVGALLSSPTGTLALTYNDAGNNLEIDLNDTIVTPGTYGSAAVYPVITVDTYGRVTNVTTQPVPGGALEAQTTGTQTNTSNATYVNITDLSLTLAANTTYYVNYTFIGQAVATTTGTAFAFNGGTVVPTSVTGYIETAINGASAARLNFVTLATNNIFPSCAVANQRQLTNCEMVIVTGGTGGTLVPQFRSEVSGSQVSILVNSTVIADAL